MRIIIFVAVAFFWSCNNSQPTHEEQKKIAQILNAPPPPELPNYVKQLNTFDTILERCSTEQNSYLVGCLRDYNMQMDSMLIVVSKTLYTTLEDSAKKTFAIDEINWKKLLKKEEQQLEAAYKAQGGGERDLYWQDRGAFINKRVKEIVSKIK